MLTVTSDRDYDEQVDVSSSPVNPNYRKEKRNVSSNGEDNSTNWHDCDELIARKNREALLGKPSKGTAAAPRAKSTFGVKPSTSSHDCDDLIARKNREALHGKPSDTAAAPQTSKSTFGVKPNKREAGEHPLIASPLNKHIKTVYDSACSNSICTATKAPFPLLPQERLGEEEKGRNYLDVLGAATGVKNFEARKTKESARAEEKERGADEERAVDLLTSAAFLFKHSRRKLN